MEQKRMNLGNQVLIPKSRDSKFSPKLEFLNICVGKSGDQSNPATRGVVY